MAVPESYCNFVSRYDLTMEVVNRLSPQELADLVITSPKKFQEVDFGYHTDWNLDYLYAFFCCVEDDDLADMIQELLMRKWKDAHHFFETFSQAHNNELINQLHQFQDDLVSIRRTVREMRDENEKRKEWEQKWLKMAVGTDETVLPQYDVPAVTGNVQFRQADLPEDLQKNVLFKDDQTYSCFVKDMRGPVKTWIDKHNKKDWNVVKIVCMLHEWIPRHIPVKTFSKLLSHLIPDVGDQEENMKKRHDANKVNITNLRQAQFFKLRNDIAAIEECFADTLKTCA